MNPSAPLPLTERVCAIIHGTLRALGRRHRADSILGPALSVALINLVALRLENLRRRFVTLVERMQAGTLRKLPEPAQGPARKSSGQASRPNPLAEHGVRERWGWVTHLARQSYAAELERLLGDPEMQAMIAAEPRRMGRLLRPLCRMLGVHDMPDLLKLPSQQDVETVDWAAVAKMVEAEKAARAAGLPPPVWPQPPRPAPIRKPPFRFYLTTNGPPLPA